MNRRKFLRVSGSAAALGLSGGLGLAQTLPDAGALHRLIEETPRERAEVVLRRPSVVPVHAQTSASAFHYMFRHARAETTQLLALLQSAAFMPGFQRRVRNARPDLRVDELEPLAVPGDGAEALRDAFSELAHDRTSGARKALHYLQHGGSADTIVAGARRQLARNGRQAHDYKFTEAALENHGEMAPTAWRDRILSASMAYFTGSATVPSSVSQEALQLLKS